MKNNAKIIPCYAADTAGVCSALYELGGMVIVHDASGCNSTYSTHDEPRWFDKKSMIFISALTEMDAVMGNDEKLINDICEAAEREKPKFIALCGSPMPMMTGTDFDAVAEEIQQRTGITSFALHTNGMKSYLAGAGEAFKAIAERFVENKPKSNGLAVNILGATPLDFHIDGTMDRIKAKVSDSGFDIISCFGMGSSLEEIANAATARANLVISYSGIPAAEFMRTRYGIPYVCGVPIGTKFSARLMEHLWSAANDELTLYPCAERKTYKDGCVIIGESIFAGSLAAALRMDADICTRIICPLDTETALLTGCDKQLSSEEDIENELAYEDIESVAADPMYKPIAGEHKFIELAHQAFSGRCYTKDIPDLINGDLKALFAD